MPLRLRVCTQDPEEARSRLSETYCPHALTVLRNSRDFVARHAEGGFEGLGVYHLAYGANVEVEVDPIPFGNFVLVSQPVHGRFLVASKEGERVLTPGRAAVLDSYTAYRMRWQYGCGLLTLRFDRALLEREIGALRGFDGPRPVRFPLTEPPQRSGRSWSKVRRFLVQDALSSSEIGSSPLVRGQLLRLAAASMVEDFTCVPTGTAPVRDGAVEAPAVRRAVNFIEQAADEDLRLVDLAAAARVSPRALQDGFRRHMGCTPLGYLRRVRLHHARSELRQTTADGEVTVAAVASRWGFGNLGRFATEYRRMFGCRPSDDLRA